MPHVLWQITPLLPIRAFIKDARHSLWGTSNPGATNGRTGGTIASNNVRVAIAIGEIYEKRKCAMLVVKRSTMLGIL